jgi:6-phosphogluconolactonase
VRIFDDLDSLSHAAAELFVKQAAEAIAERGRFIVALSGGSTPKRLFGLLSEEPYRSQVEWGHVWALFGDERYVPPKDEQSNERMARQSLLDKVSIPVKQILPMYHDGGPAIAAQEYETAIRSILEPDLAIDLVLLGIGPDGHTASLFPGDPSVHESERLVVASVASANARDRVTMTPVLLNKARLVLFLIAGEDKAAPLDRLLNGPINLDETPSQAIGRFAPNVEFFVDRSAVAR